MKKLKSILYSSKIIWNGLAEYRKTGTTPSNAYHQMIGLYCKTQGYSREFINILLRQKGTQSLMSNVSGVLGNLTSEDCRKIANQISQKGYFVFPEKLSPEICNRLRTWALSEKLTLSPPVSEISKASIYDPRNPMAVAYRFTENQLANNSDIQELMCDPTFMEIAKAYLKTQPVFDLMAMWWTTAFKKEADSDTAQLYHFDMDHNKWIKIFIYLTDVTPETGPHCYVEGSHKAGSKPREVLNKGYVRIPDEELRKYYNDDMFKEVCGPAGTIIAGDTAAFHKGKPVISGHRLVLEFEYGDSLFGANHDQITVLKSGKSLKEALKKSQNVFNRINILG